MNNEIFFEVYFLFKKLSQIVKLILHGVIYWVLGNVNFDD